LRKLFKRPFLNLPIMIRFCTVIFLALLSQHTLFAQHHNHAMPAPENRKAGVLPPPQLMQGIGNSHLKITTRSDSAQKYFDQGLSLLHDFWDFEALRAFEYAARLDTTAAMPHWGIYFSIRGSDKKKKDDRQKALETAGKLRKNASLHEQLYIQAIVSEDSAGKEKGDKAFVQEMDNLIHRFPDDPEAKLVLWNHSIGGNYLPNGKPGENTMYAQLLLEKLLISHPENHGVHHYWVHQMENCCPKEALPSAIKLASLAPKSGHIVHMPGHIFYRLGNYDQARISFLASMRVDSAYMTEQNINRLDTWNYSHNLLYLIANDVEQGRYRDAAAILQRHQDYKAPSDTSKSKMYNKALLQVGVVDAVDLEMRFGNWSLAAEKLAQSEPKIDTLLKKQTEDLMDAKNQRMLSLAYLRGMDAWEKGKTDAAKRFADELDATLWRLTSQEKAIPDYLKQYYNLYSYELQGLNLSASGDTAKAFKLLKEAAKQEKELGYAEPPIYHRPILLSLAQAYQRAKLWIKARETYQTLLIERPNSGFALYGLAQAWEGEGKLSEAAKAYETFLSAWSKADPEMGQVKKAKDVLRTVNKQVAKSK
jgi:tetratricopeptide (TPR) repeat protein